MYQAEIYVKYRLWTLLINAYHDFLSFYIFFSNSIEIRDHVFNYRVYGTNCCHFIVLQHVRGLKYQKGKTTLISFFFYNSYILNTFLYDKNLAWALSFILNKIYEIFNTIKLNTKTLAPRVC